MAKPENDRRIDYVEIVVRDVGRAKQFYGDVFGWPFTDYGPEYAAFNDGRLDGGFRTGEPKPGGPLVITYAVDLEATQQRIERAGGTVVEPIFGFPGGRRFHFTDPDGNELAVWSDPV
jgi:predicted enzyme related to lactoylglutathione lyase